MNEKKTQIITDFSCTQRNNYIFVTFEKPFSGSEEEIYP